MSTLAFMPIALSALLTGGSNIELLDYVETETFWRSQSIAVTEQNMLDEFRTRPVEDVSDLITQLGSDSFKIRAAATKKLAQMGPRIIPQLKKALSSENRELSGRAKRLIEQFQKKQYPKETRRLMALRALGELKSKTAIPVLKELLKSKKPFEAEYAARSIAAINGTNLQHRTYDNKMRTTDLGLLPADCGIVAQANLLSGSSSGKKNKLADMFQGFDQLIPPQEKKKMLEEMNKQIMLLLEKTGNIRIDAVTLGVSEKVSENGFGMVVIRGQYNRGAVQAFLMSHNWTFRNEKNIPVGHPPGSKDEAAFLFPSDNQMVILFGDNSISGFASKIIGYLKAGKGEWASNERMTTLVKKIDIKKPLWVAVTMTKNYREAELFENLDSLIFEADIKGKSIAMKMGVEATAGKNLDAPEKMFNEGLKEAKMQFKQLGAQIPAMKSIGEMLNTVQLKRQGNRATITAEMKNSKASLMFPLMMFGSMNVRAVPQQRAVAVRGREVPARKAPREKGEKKSAPAPRRKIREKAKP